MRVLFYDFDAGALGIQSLFAVLKASSHEVSLYLDCSCPRQYLAGSAVLGRLLTLSDKQVAADLLACDADVFCFSITSLTFASAMRIIRLVKAQRPEAIVVCGGVHATLLPASVAALPEIDFVVVGEAEQSFPVLLDTLDALGLDQTKALPPERLPGVWNRWDGAVIDRGLSPVPADLDALPFLEKSVHHAANPTILSLYSTVTIRGCFYSCTFCNDRAMREIYEQHGCAYHRRRSVDNVIAELRRVKEHYRPRHIEFHDDIFGSDPEWLAEFSRRYAEEIGIPFNMQTHPLLLDPHKLELLARCGCVTVEIGVQSVSPEIRADILRRYETNEQVETLIKSSKALGLRVETDFIVDLPGETPEHVDRLLEFVYALRPHLVNLHYLVYLPKTEITAKAIASGDLAESDIQIVLDRGPGKGKYPDSDLNARYRVLPIQLAMACAWPGFIARPVNRIIENRLVSFVLAPFAPLLVVSERLYAGLFDKRAYLYRYQMMLGIRNIARVLRRKLLGVRRPPQRLHGAANEAGQS